MNTRPLHRGILVILLCAMFAIVLLCQSCASTRQSTPEERDDGFTACCGPIFAGLEELEKRSVDSGAADSSKTETASISLLQELEIGEKYAAMLEGQYSSGTSQQLEDILKKLTRFADRPILTYKLRLLTTAQTNAFSVPGGHIFVTDGLLDAMEPTDGEIAFIIAHEMAHGALRHLASTMERASADYYTRVQVCDAARRGRIGPETVRPTFQALDITAGINVVQQEFQADQFGALYTLQAGYNFSEAVSALKKMIKVSGDINEIGTTTEDLMGGAIWSLPTHPATSERIDQLERFRNQLTEVAATAEEAVRLLQERRYADAAKGFQTILKVFPDSRSMRLNLALADHLIFRDSQSEADLARGILSNPEKLEFQWTRLLSRGAQRDASLADSLALHRALGGYEYTLSLDPNHHPARNNLAVACLDQGNYERAIRELRMVLAGDENYVAAYRNLALAQLIKLKASRLETESSQGKTLVKEIHANWDQYKTRLNVALMPDDRTLDEEIARLPI